MYMFNRILFWRGLESNDIIYEEGFNPIELCVCIKPFYIGIVNVDNIVGVCV